MIPKDIDLIVTIIYIINHLNNPIVFHRVPSEQMSARHTFKPIIIDGFNNKIKRTNEILQSRSESEIEYDPIIRLINRAIIEIIASKFEKKPGKKYKSSGR